MLETLNHFEFPCIKEHEFIVFKGTAKIMICRYAKIMKLTYGKKITGKVRSDNFSFMRNDILKYHMEQGEEKQCYMNSLMQNQIFRTLQQQVKRKYNQSKIFFASCQHPLICGPNNVS